MGHKKMDGMVKQVYCIDSSSGDGIAAELLFKSLSQSLVFIHLKTPEEFFVQIEKEKQFPWLILADGGYSDGSPGIQVLRWVMSNTRIHFTSVVLTSSVEPSDKEKRRLREEGAFSFLKKPLSLEPIQSIVNELSRHQLSPQEMRQLDHSFAEDLLRKVEEMRGWLSVSSLGVKGSLNEKLLHHFHTIKGEASSLQFPQLASCMHQVENFLGAPERKKADQSVNVNTLLEVLMNFLQRFAQQIRLNGVLPVIPHDLFSEMKTPISIPSSLAEASQSQSLSISIDSSLHLNSIEINDLEKKFRSVLQIKTRLSQFSRTLQQEFQGESFTKDLSKMVNQLGDVSSEIMNFFASLRLVSPLGLKVFCTQVLKQTGLELGKKAKLIFICNERTRIDQSVYNCFESVLTHLIRNAMDHGIEDLELRKKNKKKMIGLLRVEIREEGDEGRLCVELSDDGGGINHSLLKKALLTKQIITEDSLNRLNDESINDLVFIDGLSTKGLVTSISGRGFGLSAVRDEIQKIGGIIKVSSTGKTGTCFVIYVPKAYPA